MPPEPPRARRRPVRTCVGCRRARPATELVRARLGPAGTLVAGAGPGRGAWLCAEASGGPPVASCLDTAVRRGAFSRALRVPVPPDAVAALRATSAERERMDDAPACGGSATEKGLT